MRPHCAFATLSRRRVHWHQLNDPLAPHHSITSCHKFLPSHFPDIPESCFQVQVLDDLVIWRAGEDYDDGSGLSEIIVHNWKTGINVWVSIQNLLTCVVVVMLIVSGIVHISHTQHMHANHYVGLYRVELLSPSRLVVINSSNLAMRLYDFNPDCSSDSPPIRDLDNCCCVLKLPTSLKRTPPAFLSGCETESFITRLPNSDTPETDQSMFLPDPALATLVFRTEFTYERSQPVRGTSKIAYWQEYERYLVFVPLTTLVRCYEDRRLPQGGVTDIPDTGMSSVSSLTIPWEDWGPPLGARIIHAPEHHRYRPHSVHVRVAGVYAAELSRCYHFTISSPLDCVLSVIEALPLAATSPSHTVRLRAAASLGSKAGVDTAAKDELSANTLSLSASEENWIRGPTAWKAPFYTMYQIRKTERTIPYMTEDRKLLVGMRLFGDKLIEFR